MRRQPRPLETTTHLREILCALRSSQGARGDGEIDLDTLHDVESAFAFTFSDDILCVFAARIVEFEKQFSMTLDKVVGHTGALLEQKAPGDLIGIGQRGRTQYLCVSKRRTSGDTAIIEADVFDNKFIEIPLMEWLASQPSDPSADTPTSEFRPRIVKALPTTGGGRRVRHAKFGEGAVLREVGTGPTRKVQADFRGHGLKMIQARFLEFVDSED